MSRDSATHSSAPDTRAQRSPQRPRPREQRVRELATRAAASRGTPWERARQEHARPALVQVVGFTELLEATRFFPAGEESIQEQHGHVRDEDEHAGPDEESSESENREPQVLGVASEAVKSAGHESPTPEFCPVNLSEPKDE